MSSNIGHDHARPRESTTDPGGDLPALNSRELAQQPGDAAALCIGTFTFVDPEFAAVALRDGPAAAWSMAYARHGVAAPNHVRGDFAVAIRAETGTVFLAVDRFAIRTLCYHAGNGDLEFDVRADGVLGGSAEIDPQALFDYLFSHVIPAPQTIFKGVERLAAGHFAQFENGRLTVAPWWQPVFVENSRQPFAQLRDEFRRLVRDAVARELDGRQVGCFLSGGTDSSTVAGMLGEVTGKPARTYSIGFEAEGYDEMEYARIAARHFKTDHHEYYVTPGDLVEAIPRVAAAYDQPFGNSSVLPAFYCAQLAGDAGIEKILGGDGGDELFGGNSRYAKQRIFEAYRYLPRSVRRCLLEPALTGIPALGKMPVVRKAVSYVEQARVPMPDRLQMYNLLTRLGVAAVLTPDFLSTIDRGEPMRRQRMVYAAGTARALINRMLAFDWRYTLAENDLPKVVGATRLAGISVGFPLLDDRLVDFSLRLNPDLKLKGLQLRWFFKEALRGFLPDEILAKKKHGFGLPFGIWLTHHARLRDFALSSIDALQRRDIVRADFLDRLTREYLVQFPGYYGEMVWVLMMLEQWLECHVPSPRSS